MQMYARIGVVTMGVIVNALLAGAVAVLLLFAVGAVAQAQDDQQTVPTPGPSEIVFTGMIPAPPGTSIALQGLDDTVSPGEIVDCDTATTTAVEGDDAVSAFVLVLGESCQGFALRICWGEGLCGTASGEYGTIVDLGLIDPSRFGVDSPPDVDGHQPTAEALPDTGAASSGGGSSWLVWAGLAVIGAGLLVGAAGGMLARRR
jgi:hypothetical protein